MHVRNYAKIAEKLKRIADIYAPTAAQYVLFLYIFYKYVYIDSVPRHKRYSFEIAYIVLLWLIPVTAIEVENFNNISLP